jgi:hypothetical protein
MGSSCWQKRKEVIVMAKKPTTKPKKPKKPKTDKKPKKDKPQAKQ